MKRTFLTALLLPFMMAVYAQMPIRVYEEPKGDPPPMSLYFEKPAAEVATPDDMKIGDQYLIIYGATGGGLAGGHNGKILTMWNKTLDPKSPDFKYTDPIEVASSDGLEDCGQPMVLTGATRRGMLP